MIVLIKIDRTKVKTPDSLNLGVDSSARRELDRNVVALSANEKLTFSVYGRPDVADAVKKLSGGRCAYCGNYSSRHSVQVEHYRPKGKVILDDESCLKPGYFWLAADWENLLPACQYCNGSKNVMIIANGVLVEQKIGKGNYFPIDNDPRSRIGMLNQFAVVNEERLLFNPCIDDPDDIFDYHLIEINGEKKYLIIKAKKDLVGSKIKMTNKTIMLLGLNEENIAMARFQSMNNCSRLVKSLSETIDDGGDIKKVDIHGLIQYVSLENHAPFIGMHRRLSKDVLIKIHNKLTEDNEIRPASTTVNSLENVIFDLTEYSKDSAPDLDDIQDIF